VDALRNGGHCVEAYACCCHTEQAPPNNGMIIIIIKLPN
jgi:hypothetical protein